MAEDKVYVVTVYLKSGQTVVLRDVRVFDFEGDGTQARLKWEHTENAKTRLATLDPSYIVGVVSREQSPHE